MRRREEGKGRGVGSRGYHNQALPSIGKVPGARNVQYTGWIRLRGPEVARYDGCEGVGGEEGLEEVGYGTTIDIDT